MGKHKTKEDESTDLINMNQSFSRDNYFKITKVNNKKDAKESFRRKYRQWKAQRDIIIISMTGKYETGRLRKKELDLEDFTR